MALTIEVPLNTALADLDDALRTLLRRELARHGFDGVEIVFEAPTREWAATLSGPAVNLFLYDISEDAEFRETAWRTERENGQARSRRPALRVNASYAVSAWTRHVQDEHRLLSQVLAVLYAYDTLPADVLPGGLANGSQRFPLETKVAQARKDGGSDFWTAVGGQYKPALDYVVRLACEPGVALERGPEVRTQTTRTRLADGPRASMVERHRLGGRVRDEDGQPVRGAWVVLPDAGLWAVSDREGVYRLERVPAGEHRCVVRTADGADAETSLTVPGGATDLVVGEPAPPRPRQGRGRSKP
jgi:hypothetical protein